MLIIACVLYAWNIYICYCFEWLVIVIGRMGSWKLGIMYLEAINVRQLHSISALLLILILHDAWVKGLIGPTCLNIPGWCCWDATCEFKYERKTVSQSQHIYRYILPPPKNLEKKPCFSGLSVTAVAAPGGFITVPLVSSDTGAFKTKLAVGGPCCIGKCWVAWLDVYACWNWGWEFCEGFQPYGYCPVFCAIKGCQSQQSVSRSCICPELVHTTRAHNILSQIWQTTAIGVDSIVRLSDVPPTAQLVCVTIHSLCWFIRSEMNSTRRLLQVDWFSRNWCCVMLINTAFVDYIWACGGIPSLPWSRHDLVIAVLKSPWTSLASFTSEVSMLFSILWDLIAH